MYAPHTNLLTPGGAGQYPWINNRAAAEAWMSKHASPEVNALRTELYSREAVARFVPGTVLVYRHDVWHRGTPLTRGGDAPRLVVNLSFRRGDAHFWNQIQQGWAWAMYRPDQSMEQLVARASVEQRTALGFPAPGDRYWTPYTLEAVKRRYAQWGFDASPYELP